jgi:DNA processing protein
MIGSSTHSIDQRKLAWLTLKLLPGLGNRSLLKLVSHFGSPEAVLQANAAEIHAVEGLRPHAVKALLSRRTSRDPSVEWQMLQSKGFRLVCLADPDYPANLAAIPDPPAVLFVDGSLEPRDLVAIAVVGSRAASLTGMTFTERLSTDLAQCGVTVVSGFAMGIDSAAHRGALRARGRTLAVLGCGLDQDYPQGNREMRIQIRNSGALLTEFLLGSPPEAGHFPARNRIISGLALGVVVVEAAQRSGSLITARLALEQGREVFAVPGMARHYRSAGVHQLLRQGAKLVETAQDVLDEIRPMIRRNPAATVRDTIVSATSGGCAHQGNFSEEEAVLMASLRKEPIHIDELGHRLQWGPSRVASVLVSLELKGAVQQLPGKHFVRMLDGC